ncbi:MAG: PD40 domain-containing protein [Verrucomicrobia bacterium]|nr:PD40 domain-containing protein [Verrucomicrobiota bacterium]
MNKYLCGNAVAALLLASAVHGQNPRFSESTLGLVPAAVSMILTPDQQHLAYVVPEGGAKRIFFDGRAAGPQFDGAFVESSFVSSHDGRTAYAIVKETKDAECSSCGPQGQWRAVIDGQAGPVYDRISRFAFSSDGKSVAYGAITIVDGKDRWSLVVNGQATSLPYDALSYKSPQFSPDGQRLAYIAKKGTKTVVVVDGKEGPAYDKIGNPIPAFSADGRHMAYTARNYGQPEVVVLDGQPGPGFDNIPATSLIFSPDGGRLAYGGQSENGKWRVVTDGLAGPEYDQVDNLVFSPDGRHLAYHAKRAGKWTLIVDRAEIATGEEFAKGFATFSPDNQRIAQALKQDDKWKVITAALDGSASHVVGGEFDRGTGLVVFSRDSKHLAFVGWNGDKRMAVLDEKRGMEFDTVSHLVFSPDGQRLAYEAGKFYKLDPSKKDTRFIVIDGAAQPEYEGLVPGSLAFSADSRHVAYAVCKGDQRIVIIDGQSSPEYRAVCSVLPKGSDGFEALVVGHQLARLAWKPQS